MCQYSWTIEYCMNLTKSQIIMFSEKITKRKNNEYDFWKSLHGHEVKSKGLNLSNTVPIEDIIDNGKNIAL